MNGLRVLLPVFVGFAAVRLVLLSVMVERRPERLG